VMKIAGQRSQFLLKSGVFRSGGVESRRGGFRFAANTARGRLGLNRFFLLFGGLRERAGT
jgi:hypothetical protein